MNAVFAVFHKEVLDNLRDRQTVFYALLFGPVLIPLLVAGSLIASLKQMTINYDEIAEIPIINGERAPNLLSFLRRHNLQPINTDLPVETRLEDGQVAVVLEVLPEYAEQLRAGEPAPLLVYLNEADKSSIRAARRLLNVLGIYEQTLVNLRLQVRGLDPNVFNVLSVTEHDISRDGAGGQLLASLLPFLFILSMVMGGFYLAIDTTAGERERHSLEPLLSLPIRRWQLVLGKYLATLLFVTISGLLTALGVYLMFRFYPAELPGVSVRFDGYGISRAFALASPLLVLITSLLITVAAYTRSTKEAQTYLGLLMVIPIAPFFALQFLRIRSDDVVMLLPMLSQYKLLEKVAKDEFVASHQVLLSFSGSLLAAALLFWIAIRLYRNERLFC